MIMLNKSLLIQPNSGFVPFSAAGSADHPTAARLAPQLESVNHWAAHVQTASPWEAPGGVGVRRVEMVILASICGYFTFGLGGLLGLY
jgi:hypothetical protein